MNDELNRLPLKHPRADTFIKIAHYLATETVIDPIAAIFVTQKIMDIINEDIPIRIDERSNDTGNETVARID